MSESPLSTSPLVGPTTSANPPRTMGPPRPRPSLSSHSDALMSSPVLAATSSSSSVPGLGTSVPPTPAPTRYRLSSPHLVAEATDAGATAATADTHYVELALQAKRFMRRAADLHAQNEILSHELAAAKAHAAAAAAMAEAATARADAAELTVSGAAASATRTDSFSAVASNLEESHLPALTETRGYDHARGSASLAVAEKGAPVAPDGEEPLSSSARAAFLSEIAALHSELATVRATVAAADARARSAVEARAGAEKEAAQAQRASERYRSEARAASSAEKDAVAAATAARAKAAASEEAAALLRSALAQAQAGAQPQSQADVPQEPAASLPITAAVGGDESEHDVFDDLTSDDDDDAAASASVSAAAATASTSIASASGELASLRAENAALESAALELDAALSALEARHTAMQEQARAHFAALSARVAALQQEADEARTAAATARLEADTLGTQLRQLRAVVVSGGVGAAAAAVLSTQAAATASGGGAILSGTDKSSIGGSPAWNKDGSIAAALLPPRMPGLEDTALDADATAAAAAASRGLRPAAVLHRALRSRLLSVRGRSTPASAKGDAAAVAALSTARANEDGGAGAGVKARTAAPAGVRWMPVYQGYGASARHRATRLLYDLRSGDEELIGRLRAAVDAEEGDAEAEAAAADAEAAAEESDFVPAVSGAPQEESSADEHESSSPTAPGRTKSSSRSLRSPVRRYNDTDTDTSESDSDASPKTKGVAAKPYVSFPLSGAGANKSDSDSDIDMLSRASPPTAAPAAAESAEAAHRRRSKDVTATKPAEPAPKGAPSSAVSVNAPKGPKEKPGSASPRRRQPTLISRLNSAPTSAPALLRALKAVLSAAASPAGVPAEWSGSALRAQVAAASAAALDASEVSAAGASARVAARLLLPPSAIATVAVEAAAAAAADAVSAAADQSAGSKSVSTALSFAAEVLLRPVSSSLLADIASRISAILVSLLPPVDKLPALGVASRVAASGALADALVAAARSCAIAAATAAVSAARNGEPQLALLDVVRVGDVLVRLHTNFVAVATASVARADPEEGYCSMTGSIVAADILSLCAASAAAAVSPPLIPEPVAQDGSVGAGIGRFVFAHAQQLCAPTSQRTHSTPWLPVALLGHTELPGVKEGGDGTKSTVVPLFSTTVGAMNALPETVPAIAAALAVAAQHSAPRAAIAAQDDASDSGTNDDAPRPPSTRSAVPDASLAVNAVLGSLTGPSSFLTPANPMSPLPSTNFAWVGPLVAATAAAAAGELWEPDGKTFTDACAAIRIAIVSIAHSAFSTAPANSGSGLTDSVVCAISEESVAAASSDLTSAASAALTDALNISSSQASALPQSLPPVSETLFEHSIAAEAAAATQVLCLSTAASAGGWPSAVSAALDSVIPSATSTVLEATDPDAPPDSLPTAARAIRAVSAAFTPLLALESTLYSAALADAIAQAKDNKSLSLPAPSALAAAAAAASGMDLGRKWLRAIITPGHSLPASGSATGSGTDVPGGALAPTAPSEPAPVRGRVFPLSVQAVAAHGLLSLLPLPPRLACFLPHAASSLAATLTNASALGESPVSSAAVSPAVLAFVADSVRTPDSSAISILAAAVGWWRALKATLAARAVANRPVSAGHDHERQESSEHDFSEVLAGLSMCPLALLGSWLAAKTSLASDDITLYHALQSEPPALTAALTAAARASAPPLPVYGSADASGARASTAQVSWALLTPSARGTFGVSAPGALRLPQARASGAIGPAMASARTVSILHSYGALARTLDAASASMGAGTGLLTTAVKRPSKATAREARRAAVPSGEQIPPVASPGEQNSMGAAAGPPEERNLSETSHTRKKAKKQSTKL